MRQFILILCCIGILILCGGCVEKNKNENRKPVDFTICSDEQLPKEVLTMIEKKKSIPVEFTYSLQEYMYIIIGYGEQNGGGYSIRVNECSEGKQNIYVDTTLIGSDEEEQDVKSYPYIVLKCLKPEKNVIFS